MDPISDFMTRHHKDCDAAFARAEERAAAADWPGLEREAAAFLAEMERHIGMEEDLLFPAFEERTGMQGGPTATMRMEHEQMRGLFAQLRAALEARDAARYLGASETLLILLQQHNIKEESMMYPMLDQALGEEAGQLLGQLQSAAA
ncbi:MAG: hemerythrin domain-containing protein [Betaproteobacteria bacterium]|nr:hemerythrin domain-containing protein [Betaproteobacteria bacterium]